MKWEVRAMLTFLMAPGEMLNNPPYDNQLTKRGSVQYIKPADLRVKYTTLHSVVQCRHVRIKQMTSEEHGHLCQIQ